VIQSYLDFEAEEIFSSLSQLMLVYIRREEVKLQRPDRVNTEENNHEYTDE
jgi:hypothetical protein